MFFTRVLVSLFEFTLAVVMSGVAISYTYHVFVHANPDFDMGAEIKKGNVAVGTLMAAILVAASLIMQKGLSSVVSMFRLQMTAPGQTGFSVWQLCLISLSHLVVALILALMTVSVTLRLFGKLTRKQLQAGKELERGNMAVGILLSAVVLMAAMYVGEGVSALSKALVPQPSVGRVQIVK
jgi:uncharacterized membrane protein YjfL (UPF0719 family)